MHAKCSTSPVLGDPQLNQFITQVVLSIKLRNKPEEAIPEVTQQKTHVHTHTHTHTDKIALTVLSNADSVFPSCPLVFYFLSVTTDKLYGCSEKLIVMGCDCGVTHIFPSDISLGALEYRILRKRQIKEDSWNEDSLLVS